MQRHQVNQSGLYRRSAMADGERYSKDLREDAPGKHDDHGGGVGHPDNDRHTVLTLILFMTVWPGGDTITVPESTDPDGYCCYSKPQVGWDAWSLFYRHGGRRAAIHAFC